VDRGSVRDMKHIVIFRLLTDPEVIPVADNFDRWEELANGNPYAESTEDLPSEITLPDPLDVKGTKVFNLNY
jgi:hypothetical protein